MGKCQGVNRKESIFENYSANQHGDDLDFQTENGFKLHKSVASM